MTPLKRIIIITALLLTSIICFVTLQNVSSSMRDLDKDYLRDPRFDPALEKDHVKEFEQIIEIKEGEATVEATIDRDIFTEKREIIVKPLFELRAVDLEEIPIIFKGSIVRGDKVIIAQINWGNKTYFVKPGEMLKQWLISEITEDFVIIKDPDLKPFTLFLNKITYSEVMTATIMYTTDNKIYRVKIGDMIDDYKVLDIKKHNVIVSNKNSQIIISKEN